MMQRTIYRRRHLENSSDEDVETPSTVTAPTRDILSNMSGEVTRREIDSIEDIKSAKGMCKQHNVDYEHISTQDVWCFQLLLKHTLLCEGTQLTNVAEAPSTVNTPGSHGQTYTSGTGLTENDIDCIDDMRKAIKACRVLKVDYRDMTNPDVLILKLLIKLKLLKKGGTSRTDKEGIMNKRQNIEHPRMDTLRTLYKEAHKLINENNRILLDMLKYFPTIQQDFTNCICDLQHYRSPILILGETGAGKTSFINLLLGQRLLPCSLLSNTHTICELNYSNAGTLEAVVEYDDQPTKTYVRNASDVEEKQAFVEFLKEEAEKMKARKIQIHGPFNILKNNVVIVDSPGVGESEAMTNVVLDYVEKAAAFIYVIDIMNAGGVQQRVKEFVEKVDKRARNTCAVNVQNSMFVCNKCDEVPTAEKENVIQDTAQNLRKLWKGLDTSQIIPFSTTEAQWIQDRGAVIPNFGKVLDRLADLMPTAQYMTTLKAQTWLATVLGKTLYITSTYISNSCLSEKEILEKKEKAEHSLRELEEKMDTFITNQRKILGTAIERETVEMYAQVTSNEKQMDICSFDDISELPTDASWRDAAASIRTQLYKRILKAIELELHNRVQRMEDQTNEALARAIPSFRSMLNNLEVDFSGIRAAGIEEKTTKFLPEYVRKVYGKSVGMSLLLTPAMPFIALARLPMFLLEHFKEKSDMSALKKLYETAKGRKQACQTYANYVFQHVIDKIEIKAKATESMQVLNGRLNELENEMKEKIDGDRKFMRSLPEKQTTIQSELETIKGIEQRMKCLKTRADDCLKESVIPSK